MSKLLKFRKTLTKEEARQLLSSLIGQDVHSDDLEALRADDYLRPIVGSQYITLGFEDTELKKIAAGERGKAAVINELGLPDETYIRRQIDSTAFCFALVNATNGKQYTFARLAPDPENGNEVLQTDYSVEDLLPLDPDQASDIRYLAEDIFQVAEAANETGKPADPVEKSAIKLVIEENPLFTWVTALSGTRVRARAYSSDSRIEISEAQLIEDTPSYRKAVGVLLRLLEKPRPSGLNQSAIKSLILENYRDIPGLKDRNLDKIFAAANRSLKGD